MTTAYQKPVISRLETGLVNKYGAHPLYARRVRTKIDGVAIDDLLEAHGSPLFVFSERKLRESYRSVLHAFNTRYPHVVSAWSYKTNYLQAICAILHQEGALAEVVSEFEYQKARSLGIQGDSIIFNGPFKRRGALERAVREGARIHVDHLDEITDLESIAEREDRTIHLGIRLNIDTGIFPQWTRFGFNLENGQALDAARRMRAGGKLIIDSIHAHIGTFILDPAAYGKQTAKMAQFARTLQEELGFEVEMIDIGGGFPSRSKLKGTYLPPDMAVLPVDDYAEKITEALYENLQPGSFPKLVLETGRAVVDEAGSLVTTVFAAKRLPDGRKAYVMDAGVNTLFTSFWYKFDIALGQEPRGMNEAALINGPLCMNIDVLDEATELPPLQRGDRLIFSPVGAYNVTQWMQFIEYRPSVVLITEDGSVELIREAENLSDIERRERLPDRLRPPAIDGE